MSNRRLGFSLLEVIISTAILAGSAMLLVSLVGTGSRFGSRAEFRTLAYSVAQSSLDEFLASLPPESDSQRETTGTVGGRWPMAYRITVEPYRWEASSAGSSSPGGTAGNFGLSRVTVEVFESEEHMSSGSARALCVLHRIARRASDE